MVITMPIKHGNKTVNVGMGMIAQKESKIRILIFMKSNPQVCPALLSLTKNFQLKTPREEMKLRLAMRSKK